MEKEKVDIPETRIVDSVFSRCKVDSAFRAALKKADNPDTEYQSWEYLANFGVNLEYEERRLPYTTVFAAIAKSDRERDGSLGLGQSLCFAYDGDKESDPAKARLRRVLACSSIQELCGIIRPILRIISGKGVTISNAQLLRDLLFFQNNQESIKARWAQQFFAYTNLTTEEESE